MMNDGFAEIVHQHPAEFPGFVAQVSLASPAAAVKEAQRAVNELGACGCRSTPTSTAPRSTGRNTRNSGRPCEARQADLDGIRPAPPSGPTTSTRRNRSTRSGGRSAGPTRPPPPWAAWCSRRSSTATRTSRSSSTTSAASCRSSKAASAPAGTSSAPAPPTRTTSPCAEPQEAPARLLQAELLRRHRCVRRRRRHGVRARVLPDRKGAVRLGLPFDPEKGTGYIRETLRILDSLNLAKDVQEKIFHGNLEKITGMKFGK